MTFTADQLLKQAEQRTGLSDWGGEPYFENSFRRLFDAMVTSLHTDAHLTPSGMKGAQLRLGAMVEARLQFIDDRRRWPDITREQVLKPIFILGLPRSGSSFLHALMSQDPGNRSPLTWEMMFPSPPPTPSDRVSDPRIDRCQQIYDALGLGRSESLALHPFGAREPEECHLIMELMCLGDNLPGLWRLSAYNRVRADVDIAEGYRLHRMALQSLQYRYPAERWVLKNPGHIFHLNPLLAEYPDARIIQTHRDPARVIPSVTALLAAMRRGCSDAPLKEDRIALGNLHAFADGLNRAIDIRRQRDVDAHFHDVHFRDLIADPMATVRAVYRQFDLELTDLAQERMQSWLASEQSHAARARFTLNEFGLSPEQIDEAFGHYMMHYGVARERNG